MMDQPSSQRAFRYNAKTSLTTRCVDANMFKSSHLLRSTDSVIAGKTALKLTKKRAPLEDPDFVDMEPETKKPRMVNGGVNSSNLKVSTMCGQSSPWNEALMETVEGSEDPDDETLFVSACSLPCKYLTTSASSSSTTSFKEPESNLDLCETEDLPRMSSRHWHLHIHPEGHTHSKNLQTANTASSACIELQVLQGALARLKVGRQWPADEGLLDVFCRVNGGYDLEILDDNSVYRSM